MNGWMNALYAAAPATGVGTLSRPCVIRFEISNFEPISGDAVAGERKSGVPRVSFSKRVYFAVAKLR